MPEGQAATSRDAVATTLARELASHTIDVPLLPNVAAEVLSSSLEDKSTAGRLADLIQQDQGLASHLLRVVNSVAFRGQAEIVALQQAIARLGMERVREIALTVSLKGTLFRPGAFECLVAEEWQHGLRTGLWAKEVARAARKNVETAYLCGLLHNVGAPLVINRVCELDGGLLEADVAWLSADFAREAGLLLVAAWRLPAAVGVCIALHDNFQDAAGAKDAVAVVAAGNFLSRQQRSGGLDADIAQQQAALQHLNFYPDDITALLAHAETIEQTVEGMS